MRAAAVFCFVVALGGRVHADEVRVDVDVDDNDTVDEVNDDEVKDDEVNDDEVNDDEVNDDNASPIDRRAPGLRLDAAFSLAPRVEPSILQQDAYELFVFPYGTTGEPYLEFAPDSPAFWGVVKGAKNTTWRLTDDAPRTLPPARAFRDLDDFDIASDDNDDNDNDSDNDNDNDRDVDVDDHDDCGDVAALAPAADVAPSLWAQFMPVVDVGAGTARIDSAAVLFAVFRDGVEHDAPAGFVRRTFQGHVDNDEGAALDRTRVTQLSWAVVQLRFDLDRMVGGFFDAAAETRQRARVDERTTAIAQLLDARATQCRARPSLERTLQLRELNDLLAIFSRSPT